MHSLLKRDVKDGKDFKGVKMKISGHLYGGASIIRRFRTAADVDEVGVIITSTAASNVGVIPHAAGVFLDSVGVGFDTSTYSATPAAGATAFVTVDVRPDQIVSAPMSGSATSGTALTIATATAQDTTPDLVTSTGVGTASIIGGTMWRYPGRGMEAPEQDVRQINAWTSATSMGCAVDFETSIEVGDRFLYCPWTDHPGDGTDTSDGSTHLEATTDRTAADIAIASGTGGAVRIYKLIMRSEIDSIVEFILRTHFLNNYQSDIIAEA
jgi:hypothetical protein